MAKCDIALGAQQHTQIVDGTETVLLNDGRKTAFKQIMLVLFKHDAHLGMDMLLKEAIVLRQDLGDDRVAPHKLFFNFSP